MQAFPIIGILLTAIYQVLAIPHCPGNQWTQFYDRDNPSGKGDYETLHELRKAHPGICEHPGEIDVRLVDGGYWYEGGNVITQRNGKGFICENKKQPAYTYCHDYKVRFCCPKEPKCSGYWTNWYDRDNPSATGDWETLKDIRKENKHDNICEYPLEVHARLTDHRHYLFGYDTLTLHKHTGLICKNKDQKDGKCNDYKVRFCCPKCYWTKYFDRDDPSATGDWETLADLRKEKKIKCHNPVKIDARLVHGGGHYSTGGNVLTVDKNIGLICKNADQGKGSYGYHGYGKPQCRDYEVRFYCCD